MKKFLSKMPVMIVFLSLAVVGLAFYIVMLARPISYGMTYSYTQTITEDNSDPNSGINVGENVSIKIKFYNDKKAVTIMDMGSGEIKSDVWVLRIGNKVAILSSTLEMNEDEYNQMVEEIKENKELFNASATEINAFKIYSESDSSYEMKCNGAVVFAVVFGVVELALITFGVLATIFFVKGKKAVPTESNDATDTPVAA